MLSVNLFNGMVLGPVRDGPLRSLELQTVHLPSSRHNPRHRLSGRQWTRRPRRSRTGGVRWGLVKRVRQQIMAGTHQTPENLDIAVERLLEDLGYGGDTR